MVESNPGDSLQDKHGDDGSSPTGIAYLRKRYQEQLAETGSDATDGPLGPASTLVNYAWVATDRCKYATFRHGQKDYASGSLPEAFGKDGSCLEFLIDPSLTDERYERLVTHHTEPLRRGLMHYSTSPDDPHVSFPLGLNVTGERRAMGDHESLLWMEVYGRQPEQKLVTDLLGGSLDWDEDDFTEQVIAKVSLEGRQTLSELDTTDVNARLKRVVEICKRSLDDSGSGTGSDTDSDSRKSHDDPTDGDHAEVPSSEEGDMGEDIETHPRTSGEGQSHDLAETALTNGLKDLQINGTGSEGDTSKASEAAPSAGNPE